jgi:hypothetical protein
LNDKRFIFDLNNDQKWLYIGLLLLAGSTKNSIPNDENYIKNRLNLPENSPKIRENIETLLKVFPKLLTKNGNLIFKNFNDLHNKIGNYFGTPSDTQSDAKGNKEKRRTEQIRTEYVKLKGWVGQSLSKDFYGRSGKAINKLCLLGTDEEILACLKWVSQRG